MLIDEESIAAAWKSLLKSERSKGQIVYVPHGAERPVRFSREQIFRLALQICNALHRKLEVPKFGRVALLAGADPNATAICHGCWLGNFSLVLVDPKASIERLIAVINNAEVDTVFFSMAHMMTMSKLIKSCAGVRHWVLTEGSGLNGHGTSLHVLANLLGDSSKTVVSTLEEERVDYPALITFTSGFNGKLTGVSFTQTQLLTSADNLIKHFSLRKNPESSVGVLLEPNNLVFTQWAMFALLGSANQIVLFDPSHAKRLWSLTEKLPIQHLFLDYSALDQIPRLKQAGSLHLPEDCAIHIVSNEQIDATKINGFRTSIKRPVHPCYYQTEGGGLLAAVRPNRSSAAVTQRTVLCCGEPLAGVELSVLGTDGTSTPSLQEGEIVLETEQLMSGYEATTPGDAQLASETTLRTGDRGFLSAGDNGETLLFFINRMQEALPTLPGAPLEPAETITETATIRCITQDDQSTTAEPTKDPSSVSELVPDRNNLTHLLALARDPNARTPDLTKAFLQDPVVTLELIRTYQFASGRTAGAPLQDLKDVIVLLGPALIQDLCEQLLERQQFNNPNTVKWLTAARKRCVKAGNIAYKLADTLRGSNPEEARIAAMLKELGDLELICKHPEAYVGHAEQLSRVKLVYQMAKEHGFHPDASAVSFLKRMQCPQNLLELIDPEASPSAAEKTKLRMICRAASEVVELDSQENLEKLSPTKTLSSRSALRVLQIPPNQYAELFEEFTSIIDHVNKQEALAPAPEPSPARDELESTPQQEETSSETEVQHPNHLLDDLNEIVEAELAPSANDKLENVEPLVDEVERPTLIMAPKLQIDKPMPRFNTVAIDSMIANSAAIIATQKDPMDTISSVMESMITQSPFSRAALVLVNFETMEAQVLEGRGIGFENGGVSIIDDSNSSFLSREVQIYSFAKQGKHKTLFGSMTYAMGPVGMNDSQTLLLYADCGPNEVLPFASRRMFRQLLTMLQKHCGGVLDDDNEKFAQQEESQ